MESGFHAHLSENVMEIKATEQQESAVSRRTVELWRQISHTLVAMLTAPVQCRSLLVTKGNNQVLPEVPVAHGLPEVGNNIFISQ